MTTGEGWTSVSVKVETKERFEEKKGEGTADECLRELLDIHDLFYAGLEDYVSEGDTPDFPYPPGDESS